MWDLGSNPVIGSYAQYSMFDGSFCIFTVYEGRCIIFSFSLFSSCMVQKVNNKKFRTIFGQRRLI